MPHYRQQQRRLSSSSSSFSPIRLTFSEIGNINPSALSHLGFLFFRLLLLLAAPRKTLETEEKSLEQHQRVSTRQYESLQHRVLAKIGWEKCLASGSVPGGTRGDTCRWLAMRSSGHSNPTAASKVLRNNF